jgi:hypothetical protein
MHTSHSVAVEAQHKNLNVLLWGLQSALALTFLITGVIKLMLPMALVTHYLPWSAQISEPMIRALGTCELVAVWGLMVPGLTHTATRIVSGTAWALSVMMLCAIFFHLARNEASLIALPVALASVSAIVALGRGQVVPISSLDD